MAHSHRKAIRGIHQRTVRLLTTLLLGALPLAATAHAGVPPECGDWPQKPAWEWTDQERLERRADKRCVAARRALAEDRTRRDGSCRMSGNVTDFIYGTDTPELFLPTQLFDGLLHRVFVGEPDFAALQRPIFEEHIRAQLPLPENFWKRVETIAADYLALLREQRAMASKLDGASPGERRKLLVEFQSSQRANCAARHRALTHLRSEFEEINFDRVLYIAVAPGLCSGGDDDLKVMEWVARGCSGR